MCFEGSSLYSKGSSLLKTKSGHNIEINISRGAQPQWTDTSTAPKDQETLEKKGQNDLKSQKTRKPTVRLLHPRDVKEDALIIPQWYGCIKKALDNDSINQHANME